MSVENVKKFIDLIKSTEGLKAELKELCKIEDKAQAESAFEALAKKNGCECSFAEFMQAQKESLTELSPEDLDKVDAAGWGAVCCVLGFGIDAGASSDDVGACLVIGVGFGDF